MFDAKDKVIRLEWTRMKEKKHCLKTLFRVIGAYKNSLLLGFLLGILLVVGDFFAIQQFFGLERPPLTLAKTEVELRRDEKTIPEYNSLETKNEGLLESNNKGENKVRENELNNPDPVSEVTDSDVPNQDHIGNNLDVIIEESIPTINQKQFTVLLVGVDQRPGEKSYSNTDTLLVASINTVNGQISLLSIPRDTQVNIPGYGKEKINAAARLGKGLITTQSLVEEITGQPIDGYVLTNFNGFKKMIDTLGGITVTVEKDMYYVTGDKEDGTINLKKGTQRLNGTQALQYARFRQDALADISRTSRQQAVLKAMVKELKQVKTLPKLPALIAQMTKSMETNLSAGELWSLANILSHFKNPEVISQTLPGNFLIEDEISYWKVDPLKSHAIIRRFLDEGKTTSVFFQ
ncbi:LCP family protein [Desulfosporosinus hippei]